MKLEGYSGPMCNKRVHSTMTRSSRFHCPIGVINKPTTDELWISPVYRRYTQLDRRRFVYDTYKTMKVTQLRHGWVHMFITHRPTLTLQLHNFDLFSGLVVQVVFALLRGNWQDFNWHDASRCPSTIAELLVKLKCDLWFDLIWEKMIHDLRMWFEIWFVIWHKDLNLFLKRFVIWHYDLICDLPITELDQR